MIYSGMNLVGFAYDDISQCLETFDKLRADEPVDWYEQSFRTTSHSTRWVTTIQ